MEAWIPFLQSLVWPVFLGVLLFAVRGWVRETLDVIKKRIEAGSEFSVGPGGLTLGDAPRLAPPQNEKEVLEAVESMPKTPVRAPTSSTEVLAALYLVHTAAPAGEQGGRTYYRVRVQLQADSGALLDRVEKVVYHLHPTFPDPDRTVTDRAKNFELEVLAWGQFNLSADVYLKGAAEPLRLYRYLNF